MLEQTQIVNVVLELFNDKNPNIRKLVSRTLDLVQLHNEMWKQQIKTKKFHMHNEVYLELMESQANGGMVPPEGMDPAMYEQMDEEALLDYMYEDPEFAEEQAMMQGAPGMNTGMYADEG